MVCEDELAYAIDLEMMLQELGFEKIYLRDNFEAANQVLENVPIGLALLDINIQGRNRGLDLGKRTLEKNIPTIFISSFTDETVFQQAEMTKPMAYLNKPFQKLTLRSLIQTVLAQRESPAVGPKDLFIKNGRQLERIPLDSIQFIEAEGNYSVIHTDKKRFAQKISLKNLLEELPAALFIQVHKGFVVRLALIKNLSLEKEELSIGEKAIPIGRSFKVALLEAISWR